MNIAVIDIKDILKFIFKLGIVICLIYVCMHFFNTGKKTSGGEIKKGIENKMQKISNNSFLECLDTSLSLFSYKKANENTFEVLSSDKILAMGTGIFDKSILKNTDLTINEEELTIDDTEELVNQIKELPKDVSTETVEENNITAKYTTEYGSVKINNQSDYELTEEILNPDVDISNKKDILIYHTHTCESYTQSERIRI